MFAGFSLSRVRTVTTSREDEISHASQLAMFLERAQDKEEDFDLLCQVMMTLVEQGVRDERALKIVRERFVAEGGGNAAWVLHEAGDPGDVTLFVHKVREQYRNVADEPDTELPAGDLHNLLAFIPDEDERYPDLLREGRGGRRREGVSAGRCGGGSSGCREGEGRGRGGWSMSGRRRVLRMRSRGRTRRLGPMR